MPDKSASIGVLRLKRYTHLFCISMVLSCVPGALAQTLTVSPSSVTFTYVSKSGNIPPSQTVMVTSSAGATLIGISADPAKGNPPPPQFAAVVPPSGMGAGATTPATLTIRLAPASILDPLAPGTYTLTFSIYGPAGTNTPVITVTLAVSSAAPPPPTASISVNPSSVTLYASTEACAPRALTISGTSPIPNPTTQCIKSTSAQLSISLSSPTSSTPVTGTVTATNGLIVSPTTITVYPGTATMVDVTANPSGSSNYTGTVAITAGSTPLSVTVTVVVSSAALATVTGSSIAVYPQVPQTFSLRNWGSPSAATFPYTLAVQATACPVSALSVSPMSGSVAPGQPVTFSVQFIPAAGQTSITCAWAIAISVPGAANPSISILVQGLNLPGAFPVVSPGGGVELSYQPGAATSESRTIVVAMSDGSGGQITVTGPSWLALDKTAGTSPSRFQFGLNSSALAGYSEGTYLSRAVIAYRGGTYPVPLTLKVCSPLPSGFYISEVMNNFGRTPGLTKNSIAAGTIGVVKGKFGGSNGSGKLNSTAPPGLPTVQDGDSITIVDSSGATQNAPLFYVSPTQFDFLLSSKTPLGDATATVTTSGGTTRPFPFTVVPATPALVTFSDVSPQTVAVVDNITGTLVTGTHPMVPNRWFQVYGSGVADPLDPDNVSTTTPHAFPGNTEAIIGGVPATVAYSGSSGIPGLFEVVLMAGANTPNDCLNSFELVYNSIPAFTGSVPFSSDGSACTNQLTRLTAGQIGDPNLKVIIGGLTHTILQDGTTTDSAVFIGGGSLFFASNLYNRFRRPWGYGCTVDTESEPGTGSGGGLFAGQSSVSVGSSTFLLPMYSGNIGASGVTLPANTLTPGSPIHFAWSGGEISGGSFTGMVPSWTFVPKLRPGTVEVDWTGAQPGSRLNITYRRTDSTGPTVTCMVDGAAGSFVPPDYVARNLAGVPATIAVENIFDLIFDGDNMVILESSLQSVFNSSGK